MDAPIHRVGYTAIVTGTVGLGLARFGGDIGGVITRFAARVTAPFVRGLITGVAEGVRGRQGRGEGTAAATVVLGFGIVVGWGGVRRNLRTQNRK